MAKNKLKRFSDMKEWTNCFEPSLDFVNKTPFLLKGKWKNDYFKNSAPIVLE